MKKLTLAMIAATTALTISSAASAATLYDQTNIPSGQSTQSFTFTGAADQTSLSFAGYNPPSITTLSNIMVQLNGMGANLLSGNYVYTPAANQPYAFNPSGVLQFGGFVVGSYDTFTTTFASNAGSSYTLSYNLSSGGNTNGLRVTTAAVAGAVPEPATWALMILGMGAVGFAMRRRKNVNMTVRFA